MLTTTLLLKRDKHAKGVCQLNHHIFSQTMQVSWIGSADKADAGRQCYKKAQVGSWAVELGSVVQLEADQEGLQQQQEQQQQHVFGLVQCMWEDEDRDRMAQVKV